MIAGLLRLFSTVATVLVVLGFALFAIDETRAGSETTVARLDGRSAPAADRDREKRGGVRGAIDEANDVLLAPFDGIVSGSQSAWVHRGVPALLGFVIYGPVLRLLANATPQRRRHEPLGWDVPR